MTGVSFSRSTVGRVPGQQWKRTLAIGLLALGFPVAAAMAQPPASSEAVSARAAELIENGSIAEVVQLFHIPPSYSAAEKEEETSALTTSLTHLMGDFGALTDVRPVRGLALYYNVGAGSGDSKYWQSIGDLGSETHVFAAQFENLGRGYVKLVTVSLEGSSTAELRSVDFGLPVSRDDSKTVTATVFVRLLRKRGVPGAENLQPSVIARQLQPTESRTPTDKQP